MKQCKDCRCYAGTLCFLPFYYDGEDKGTCLANNKHRYKRKLWKFWRPK